jgi:hypothetical protein
MNPKNAKQTSGSAKPQKSVLRMIDPNYCFAQNGRAVLSPETHHAPKKTVNVTSAPIS